MAHLIGSLCGDCQNDMADQVAVTAIEPMASVNRDTLNFGKDMQALAAPQNIFERAYHLVRDTGTAP